MENIEEKKLSSKYAQLCREISEKRAELKEVEAEMIAIKPISEWKVDNDEGWKIRPTSVKTHLFEEDDEPIRVLADSPHIPASVKKEVFRFKPVSITSLKSLAGYGREERLLVKEALRVTGEKSRLTYTEQKKE